MGAILEANPSVSWVKSAQTNIDEYFSLENSSWKVLALKIASYMTLAIPALMYGAKLLLSWIEGCTKMTHTISQMPPLEIGDSPSRAVLETPAFNGYRLGNGAPLGSVNLRPSNFLYRALFGGWGQPTLPGTGRFRFTIPFERVRERITRDRVVEVNNTNIPVQIHRSENVIENVNSRDLYGPGIFRISGEELERTLDSQRIYCSSLLPLPFYRGLKAAMIQDNLVFLPEQDILVRELRRHSGDYLDEVRRNPEQYGFRDLNEFNQITNLTLYQLGSLVVKTEDFRVLVDQNWKIRERNPGEQDALRLINACGIRNIRRAGGSSELNRRILTAMFSTALQSAQDGYLVMPAVGMGVWGGDPNLYWPAFLDAVVNMNVPIEKIFINPGHQNNRGMNGNEFEVFLNQYLSRYKENEKALQNLQKIVNLFHRKTDLVFLAQNLKKVSPEKTVSIFNASDPDVTLGNHVGEYVNTLTPRGFSTTEESFTMLGTNGLCFEGITQIHQHPEKILQAK